MLKIADLSAFIFLLYPISLCAHSVCPQYAQIKLYNHVSLIRLKPLSGQILVNSV